ncbi:hypothetical protein K437DRAFT_48952 [Tilletiaria anomala UBC 951]|uniref:RA-domain-containing protein n=1 Tax=Tilletiaria anomala (strain ATCC 24038 / CBS 436.72 / UBC 951) TaxID=1037660 RepID=A0A066V8X7_TILAU|nr:uncharacterized protein K437DRAFT_48952 [Tilletiaria anomala UBC 951]KDN36738.1 hypothetical protein K437DRAFT_48952 [Tilletiaria anomala UBC 951]
MSTTPITPVAAPPYSAYLHDAHSNSPITLGLMSSSGESTSGYAAGRHGSSEEHSYVDTHGHRQHDGNGHGHANGFASRDGDSSGQLTGSSDAATHHSNSTVSDGTAGPGDRSASLGHGPGSGSSSGLDPGTGASHGSHSSAANPTTSSSAGSGPGTGAIVSGPTAASGGGLNHGAVYGSSSLNTPPISPKRPHLTRWELEDVRAWLVSVNCGQYADKFEENGINGEVLHLLDDNALKDMGILSVGQRLHILNGIFKLKEFYGLPILEGDYIPLSEEVARNSVVIGAVALGAAAAANTTYIGVTASAASNSIRDSTTSSASVPLSLSGVSAAPSLYGYATGAGAGAGTGGAGPDPGSISAGSIGGGSSTGAGGTGPSSIRGGSGSGAGGLSLNLSAGGIGGGGGGSLSASGLFNAIPSPWHIAGILREKDERIHMLEHEVNRLGEYLCRVQQDFVGICRILNVQNALSAELPPLQPFVPLRKLSEHSAASVLSHPSGLPEATHSGGSGSTSGSGPAFGSGSAATTASSSANAGAASLAPLQGQRLSPDQQALTPTGLGGGPGSSSDLQGAAELSFSLPSPIAGTAAAAATGGSINGTGAGAAEGAPTHRHQHQQHPVGAHADVNEGLQYASVAVGGHARAGDLDSPTERTPVSARLGGAVTRGVGGTGQPPSFQQQQQGGEVEMGALQMQQQQQQQETEAEGSSFVSASGTYPDVLADPPERGAAQGEAAAANARPSSYGKGHARSTDEPTLDSPTVSTSTQSQSHQSNANTSLAATPTSATHQSSSAGFSSSNTTNKLAPPSAPSLAASTTTESTASTADSATSGTSSSAAVAAAENSSTSSNPASGATSKDKPSSTDNPYKSFRVTLDDPCHKVLPAALKKYKINDDWKQYALFICYGNTERCLSYDEKPLLLFQKLKESKQNPVFMLRNIKDVKSPIAIANAKAEARGLQSGWSRVAKKREELLQASADAEASGTTGTNGEGGELPKGRSLPPLNTSLNVPGSITPALMSGGVMQRQQSLPRYVGPASALPKNGIADASTRTYAIAIYPYASERDDEFDVAVGDTYIVLSKAKGWWIVQGDSKADGTGDIDVAQAKVGDGDGDETDSATIDRSETEANGGGLVMESGWVPAGCLLEVSRPLLLPGTSTGSPATPQYPSRTSQQNTTDDSLAPDAALGGGSGGRSLSPGSAGSGNGSAGSDSLPQPSFSDVSKVPISPSIIISTSTPGVMLMDFSAPDRDLVLKRNDKLRVFKRYNHWSYCVKEGNDHSRGWVPSWFIGKATSSKPATSRNISSGSSRNADLKSGDSHNSDSAGANAAPEVGAS